MKVIMTSTFASQAQKNVQAICANGPTITLVKAATKDAFGTPLSETTMSLHAYPVMKQPLPRAILQAVAWANEIDIIAYLSKADVDALSKTIRDMQDYHSFRFDGKTYEIKYIENYQNVGGVYTYVIIGGKNR